jgi:hypothetical protein
MSRVGSAAVLCAIVVLGLAWPAQAAASGTWEWPVDGAVVAAYGARYTSAQGVACTHGGVDIGAPQGTTVRACAEGEIVFAGQVPAGDGERAGAMTVLTADGLRVTYLPLGRLSVAKGASVCAGAVLGDLAGAGDSSSAAPHLHLGVRRGETRLDPLSLLGERAAATGPAPAPKAPRPAGDAAPAAPHAPPSVAHAGSPPAVVGAPARGGGAVSTRAGAPAAQALMPHVALPGMPTLRQMSPVADLPRVRTAEVAADVGSMRDFLGALLARLGLVGLAGACVWPVLRGVLRGQVGRSPAAIVVRRDGA